MPEHITNRNRRPPSGGGRVFADDAGRLWNASHTRGQDGAVVFACISDSRQSPRAIAVEAAFRLTDVEDDVLREWLREAPRMGRLT